jgi:hypothetical protein
MVSHLRSKDRKPESSVSIVPSQKSLVKRESMNPEDSSSSMHLVSGQKKRRLSTIDSESKAELKKVKIEDNPRGLDDHLQNGLDSKFYPPITSAYQLIVNSHILWHEVVMIQWCPFAFPLSD